MVKDIAKTRLVRLADDLADLSDMGFKPFGFGIITASPPVRLRQPNGWKFLEFWLERLLESGEPLRAQPLPRFDPFPDGSACVRWWGDVNGVKAYQKWAGRALKLLRKHPDWPANVEAEPGYYGMLAALVRFAERDADLSRFVQSRRLVDLNSLPRADRMLLSKALLHLDPLPVFSVEEVSDSATWFTDKILKKLLGKQIREPRLSANLSDNTITLDRKTYALDPVYVLILHELQEANGKPITRSQMQQKQPTLALEERLDRKINDLRWHGKQARRVLPFPIPILTAEKQNEGYYLPSDYLA
jgi:hypothetical protein